MPSRLSSLLVRDGLVGVKRIEKAFQRQVIYGGSLDTILLEMNLVPEDRLTQYLALAFGVPPASREEVHNIATEARLAITEEVADQFRAVPLASEAILPSQRDAARTGASDNSMTTGGAEANDGNALRILVCSPVEIAELEDLADLLDRPLQPLITPEYRWQLAFAAAYQREPPARFTTLARTLEIEGSATPVGRARSVIVEMKSNPSGATPAQPDAQAPQPATQSTEATPLEPRPPIIANPPPTVSAAAETARLGRTTHRGFAIVARPPGVRSPTEPGPYTDSANPTASNTSNSNTAGSSSSDAVPIATMLRNRPSRPIATTGRDSPLAVVRARELLASAEDRDSVFLTLLRATRSRARYAALLTIQGGVAIGRVALAEPGIDTQEINKVLIPLDVVSPFRSVTNNSQPHIGPLGGDPSIGAMLLRFGGALPPSALILPIVLRDRVVAVVVAHRGHSDLKLADVAELLPLATATAEALGRLIVKHKADGPADRSYAITPDHTDTARIVKSSTTPLAHQDSSQTRQEDAGPSSRRGSSSRIPRPTPAEVGSEKRDPTRTGQAESANVATLATLAPLGSPRRGGSPRRAETAQQGEAAPQDSKPVRSQSEPSSSIDKILDEIETAAIGEADAAFKEATERPDETLRALIRRFPGKLRVHRLAVAGPPLRPAQYGGLLELVVRLGPVSLDFLIDKMSAPDRDVRFYATVCALEQRPRNAATALVERLFDQDPGVRGAAIEALAGYPRHERSQSLARARRAVHSTDLHVVAHAAAAIVALSDTESIGDLIGSLERGDRSSDHVRRALIALTAQDFGTNEKKWRKWWSTARRKHRIAWLIEGLVHRDDAIRESSIQELRRLTGEYFGYHHDLPRKEREAAAERWTTWWRDVGMRRFGITDPDSA